MAYSHITWSQLKTQLANRLYDADLTFWSDDELGLYLTEALQTWGLLTAFWRDKGVLNTSANTPFYDITSLTNGVGDDLLTYTVTDSTLVSLIQYHLCEPSTGTSWTGSEQFTLNDVTNALQRRRDQFLADTGCVVTRTAGISGGVPPVIELAITEQTVSPVRRLALTDADGTVYPITPTDVSYQRNYSSLMLMTPGIPITYSSASTAPLSLLLAPPAANPGTFETLSTLAGAALDPTVGVVLGIPDDMAWVVKWGALADLLGRDGPARDIPRSYFCERKYQLGVELAKTAPVVVNAEIDGVSLSTESISDLDSYNSSWQSSTGQPQFLASMENLIALANCPDDIYSVTLDVVRKAIIPTAAGDFVQIGREYIDALLDYAEHLAAFKEGGQELASTLRGAQNFFDAALSYNEKLAAQNPAAVQLMRQSSADEYDRPIRKAGGLGTLQDATYGRRTRQIIGNDNASTSGEQ